MSIYTATINCSCGHTFEGDSDGELSQCPKCGSATIGAQCAIGGRRAV